MDPPPSTPEEEEEERSEFLVPLLCLRGSSGGDSRLRVRVCRLLERLLLWCHEFGGVWSFSAVSCAWLVFLVMLPFPFYCRQAVCRISWTSCSRPSLCNDRCRFWSGQCSALPVETPQVQFLDEVIVISTGFMVQTVQTVQLQLILIDISYCGAEAELRGEIPQLPYSWWSMSLLCSSTSLSRRRGFFPWSRRFVGPLRLCFLRCRQALMLCIMAGMDQKDSYAARFDFAVVVQRPVPMVQTARRTTGIRQFVFDKMMDVLVVQDRAGFSRAGRQHPCREPEAASHGLSYH